VDFFEFLFVDFAVFNVADCFVTVGAFLAVLDLLFIDRSFLWEDSSPKKKADAVPSNVTAPAPSPAEGDADGGNS